MKENKKLIIFDFDGVLVNTLQFSFFIHKELNKDLTWEKFQDFSNGNFHDGILKEVEKGDYIIPSNWGDYYDENVIKLTISDVLNNTIKILSEDNILTIVSSSRGVSISKFLVKEGLKDYFMDILGSDAHRSKVFKINLILNKYNINPDDTLFITDSLGDILEANETKIKSIGVTWGIHSKKTLEKGDPIAVIDDPRDLLLKIQNVLK